ncbi:unnamed protein product [Parnassius apollo]|uniref:(apollo) hypothetical protein n=1 Tax=Parnassius apollo TaxID=110799 RepID=A0A8S3Y0X1_PARAO|nr:unnamed protein product [Parnassius apollo]
MAGIALGYNYSIAEFMTLRNSQMSVFMKRDVTDDASRSVINWQHSESDDQRRSFTDQEQSGPSDNRYADRFTSNKQLYKVAIKTDGENKYERLVLPIFTKSLDTATALVNSVSKGQALEESKENKTIANGQNVTFLADYDESELKNWRRVVQNNNIYSIPERYTLVSSSQDVNKLPDDRIDHKSSVRKAAIRNQESETDFKTTLQLHLNTRSRPNRRKIYTMTRTIATYIVPKPTSNLNKTFQDNVVGVTA